MLALLLMICFNKSLIKEPPTKSSFKLIYKIIKFAIVTKHPRCRSAFTYCEDELPSRIDFGKSKCGGPFTTEHWSGGRCQNTFETSPSIINVWRDYKCTCCSKHFVHLPRKTII